MTKYCLRASVVLLISVVVFSFVFVKGLPQGDFVLKGSEVFEVKNETFNWEGNVILKDNATLVVDGGTFKVIQPQTEYNYTLLNQSRIILRNGANLTIGPLVPTIPIHLRDNSTLDVEDSYVELGTAAEDYSQVWAKNSELRSLGANAFTTVYLNNTRVFLLGAGDKANLTITDSEISTMGASGNAFVSIANSRIGGGSTNFLSIDQEAIIWMFNSTLRDPGAMSASIGLADKSTLWLINCTLDVPIIQFRSVQARLIYAWYLAINVKSPNGNPQADANVKVFSQNMSLVASGKTDSDGNVQFILPQWISQQLGGVNVADYEVEASYGNLQVEATITLDSSKQLTLVLAERSSVTTWTTAAIITALILAAFLAGVVLSVIILRKKGYRKPV